MQKMFESRMQNIFVTKNGPFAMGPTTSWKYFVQVFIGN